MWLKTIHPEKGSKLEEAVRYSLNQKQQLTAFLGNGEVPISNNLAENAIRPFTLGRKNWLFCDTTKGAEASAIPCLKVQRQTVLNPLPISSMCWWSCRTWEKTNPTKNWNRSCLGHPISSRNSV